MIHEVRITRDGREHTLSINEIQSAYNAMLWATLFDEVMTRLEEVPDFERFTPYLDDIVEGLRQEVSDSFSDDVISDMLWRVLEDVAFEHDLDF